MYWYRAMVYSIASVQNEGPQLTFSVLSHLSIYQRWGGS